MNRIKQHRVHGWLCRLGIHAWRSVLWYQGPPHLPQYRGTGILMLRCTVCGKRDADHFT